MGGWGHTHTLVIDETGLDVLDNLADLLEERKVGIERPNNDSVSQFMTAVHSWLSLVQQPEFDLDRNTVQQIVLQLQHILFLLDTVDTFGAGRIAFETEAVIGKIAVHTSRIPPDVRPRWIQAVGGLLQALVMFCGTVDVASMAIERGSEAFVETVQEIEDAVDAVQSDEPSENQ
jgi:hypothetical protein